MRRRKQPLETVLRQATRAAQLDPGRADELSALVQTAAALAPNHAPDET